jgi:hypothetical protein
LQKIFHYRNDKIEIVEKIMKTIVSLALGLAYPIQESRDRILLGAVANIIIPPYRIMGIEALILPKSILYTNDPNKGNNYYSFVLTNVSVAPMKL